MDKIGRCRQNWTNGRYGQNCTMKTNLDNMVKIDKFDKIRLIQQKLKM